MSSEVTPKLYCLRYKGRDMGCSPSKCTALKLKKLNLIEIINKIKGRLSNSIILTPFSRKEISSLDRSNIVRYGLIVIDCSWNKIKNLENLNFKNDRKLPPLIAANPTNYGKWEKLSSAEALAAALYITKFDDLANLILSKYRWGNQFKVLNKI
jgi:pre-rRNA-processing protein TSR3